jgi:hypothetical protein
VSSQNALLPGLNDIDWHNLQHAYGAADDVPDQLLSLAAGDDSAIAELFGSIYHQGGVYEATAYAIPFLWHLLAHQGGGGHPGIAALVSSIAEASSIHCSVWSKKCREEIWKGNSIALHLLSMTNETARRGAVSILACFPEYTGQLEAPLRGVLHRPDCSEYESARIGLALAALSCFEETAFPPKGAAFFGEAKHLAQEAVEGNPKALRTCLSVLTETIDRNPDDLSDWSV